MFQRQHRGKWFTACITAVLLSSFTVNAELPEAFQGDTPGSEYTISYDDLDALLKATVLYTDGTYEVLQATANFETGF